MLDVSEVPTGDQAKQTTVDLSNRAAALPSQDAYMGALLIGSYFAVALYGFVSHQVYRYFRMYPNDSRTMKTMIGIVWLLDTVHSVLICHTCYYYLASNYFNTLSLLDGVWSLQISITLTGIMATIAHLFFSRRVHKITKNLWVSYAIAIVSLACLGFAIATTVLAMVEVSFMKFERFTWLICSTLGLNTIADILITTTLYLYLQQCRTGFEKTDSIIDKLLIYVINTGLLNIIYNTAILVCAATMKDNLLFIGMFLVLSKLYSNSLFVVLNSRKGVDTSNHEFFFHPKGNDALTPPNVYELYGSQRRTSNVGAVPRLALPRLEGSSLKRQATIDIRITREVQTTSDQMHESEESASLPRSVSQGD